MLRALVHAVEVIVDLTAVSTVAAARGRVVGAVSSLAQKGKDG
jgi:hypothetical protein